MKNILMLLILLVILVVHYYYIVNIDLYSYPFDAHNDQALFQRIAYNLIAFNEFSGSLAKTKHFCVTRSPLYPYILSCSYLFNIKPILFIRIFQFFLTINAFILLYNISKEILPSTKIRFFVIVLACIDPHIVATIHLILSENISIFLLLLITYLLQNNHTILTGCAAGLLILNRPVFIPYLLIILLIFFFLKRKCYIKGVCCIITALILILPWSYLNKVKINQFVVTRAAGTGFNLFQNIIFILIDKNKLDLSYIYNSLEKLQIDTSYSFQQTCNSLICTDSLVAMKIYLKSWSKNPYPPSLVIKADQYLKKVSLNYIMKHKSILFDMFYFNYKNFIFKKYNFLIYSPIPYTYALYAYILKSIFIICSICVMLYWMRYRNKSLTIISMIILFFNLILVHALFHSEPRYYIYLYPFMYICCAYLLQKIIVFLRNSLPYRI